MLKEEAEQIGGLRYGKSHPPPPPPLPAAVSLLSSYAGMRGKTRQDEKTDSSSSED